MSPSGGFASLAFDQVQLNGTPSAFCINQIVPGFVVYYLNVKLSKKILKMTLKIVRDERSCHFE